MSSRIFSKYCYKERTTPVIYTMTKSPSVIKIPAAFGGKMRLYIFVKFGTSLRASTVI